MLVKKLGKESVIWRFNPLILTDKITPDILLRKIKKLKGFTEKFVFSFSNIESYGK